MVLVILWIVSIRIKVKRITYYGFEPKIQRIKPVVNIVNVMIVTVSTV